MSEPDTILVATVAGLFGIKGELKLLSYGEIDWIVGNSVYLLPKGTRPTSHAKRWKVLKLRAHKGYSLALLDGIDSIELGEGFKGFDLYADSSLLAQSAEDEYYFRDLIGLDVFEDGSTPLGKITGIIQTGANDVYQVDGTSLGEILLPATADVILKVDIEGKKIFVRVPEGLKPVNRA